MQASDRFNINSQIEHLQANEWAVNINRDCYALYIGRHPMLAYIAISENDSIGRERYNFMQKLGPVVREINGASEVRRQYHEHAPNTPNPEPDTDTNADIDPDTDSANSRPQPVQTTPCRTENATPVQPPAREG